MLSQRPIRPQRARSCLPAGAGPAMAGPRPVAPYPFPSSASSATPVIRCSGYVRTSSAVWS